MAGLPNVAASGSEGGVAECRVMPAGQAWVRRISIGGATLSGALFLSGVEREVRKAACEEAVNAGFARAVCALLVDGFDAKMSQRGAHRAPPRS